MTPGRPCRVVFEPGPGDSGLAQGHRSPEALHRAGQSLENGYVESFNGKLRDELLNREVFESLGKPVLIERWRGEYNQVRPHSDLAYRPPAPVAVLPCGEVGIPNHIEYFNRRVSIIPKYILSSRYNDRVWR